MKKINIYAVGFAIVAFVIVAGYLATWFLLPINIDFTGASNPSKITVQAVPTVVNGITASISIAVALGAAVIGVVFREEFKADLKAKTAAMVVVGFLIVALFYPWGAYVFLIIGLYEFAIKYSLSGYLFAVLAIIFAFLYGAGRLGLASEKIESDKPKLEEPQKKEPEDNKTTDQTPKKMKNVFQ